VTRGGLGDAVERRKRWISEIGGCSGDFGEDVARLEDDLAKERKLAGLQAIIDHLRLCGAIPESYGYNTSEEKLYSKYTDAVVAESFRAMGLSSAVLTERADSADVEAWGAGISLVADAKAFRLSRTARNQKDFKIESLDNWRGTRQYAVLAAPLHHMPARRSQIYFQAVKRHVLILSYSHMAVLVGLVREADQRVASDALGGLLGSVRVMSASRDARSYWASINRTLLCSDAAVNRLWCAEMTAAEEALSITKAEALTYLAAERKRIGGLSREEAISRLLTASNVDGRIARVGKLRSSSLLTAA